MARADVFILLDHVQFERRNYQNRALIRMNDEPRWLTVPVVQRSRGERVLDKEIDNCLAARRWGNVHLGTLRHAYRDAPYLGTYLRALTKVFEAEWLRLVDLNRALLELLREAFGIRTPLLLSSELRVPGQKSELVLNLCRAAGADTFLGGMGGSRSYIDVAAFERRGIEVRWQQFRHPVYRQCGRAPFAPGLSSIDMLFNCGPDSRGLLLEQADAWREPLAAA